MTTAIKQAKGQKTDTETAKIGHKTDENRSKLTIQSPTNHKMDTGQITDKKLDNTDTN
jgi:hypothetical protein